MTTGLAGLAIPKGWEWQPLKHVAVSVNRGSAPEYADDGQVWAVSQAVNQPEGLDWSRARFHALSGNPAQLKGILRPGDILINSTGRGTLGRIGYFTGSPDSRPAMADGHVTRLRTRPEVLHPRFAYYYFLSEPFQHYIYSALIVGATNQIELVGERLAAAPIAIPPIDEQRRIADFLNAETTRIDGTICRLRRQIELLDEREVSRIFDAIAGVGEPGPRKDSGLRWLGSIPADWPMLTVASQFEVLLGKMLNQERVSGDYLRPYLRNTNVQWDRIDTEDLLQMNFPPHERSRYEVLPGDLLICEGGQPGRSAIWDGRVPEIYYQKALHRARSRGRSSVRWLFYCLRVATALEVFSAEGNTTTISHLTGEQLRAYRFPFPDREVQDRSVCNLDRATEIARQTKELLAKQIALLAERRHALITAAATGQIDVTTARGVSV